MAAPRSTLGRFLWLTSSKQSHQNKLKARQLTGLFWWSFLTLCNDKGKIFLLFLGGLRKNVYICP